MQDGVLQKEPALTSWSVQSMCYYVCQGNSRRDHPVAQFPKQMSIKTKKKSLSSIFHSTKILSWNIVKGCTDFALVICRAVSHQDRCFINRNGNHS